MAIILKNKWYIYSVFELMGGILDKLGAMKTPEIQLNSEEGFWKCSIDISGKKETFYIRKGALKKYELQAIYNETFYNHRINGHCYTRPGMEIKAGDIVVDAGGCEGYYARYALNMGASRVIIFEPCPELAEGLSRTFNKEIAEGKVLIIEKALGRKKGTEILHIDRNMFCSSSILSGENECGIKKEISVITLDEALKMIGVDHIDIWKMDIEGAEVDAVLGARKTIRSNHPRLIIATYHAYYNAIRIKNICEKVSGQYKCKVYGCYQYERPYRPYMTFLF